MTDEPQDTYADFIEKVKNVKQSARDPKDPLPWVEVSQELFNYIKRDLKADGSMIYSDVEVFVKGRRDDILAERRKSVSEINHGIKLYDNNGR